MQTSTNLAWLSKWGTLSNQEKIMPEDILSSIQKAFELNMDHEKYGTIAEIGAGQEVSRAFFRAGGAAGTIAKTISAYDMSFSDAIYGQEKTKRYVTQSRLNKMLAGP